MRANSTFNRICNVLCSLGAHLGHLKVEAYQSLSHYVLGGRGLFVIIDLDKTVSMLKSAILYYEQMVLHYGHAVFCHSGIAYFNTHLIHYISRIVNSKNQSFSYWKWVPGCITNSRYVFLRLVELLFSEVRSGTRELNNNLATSYHSSFFAYYKKLWMWFVNESNISMRDAVSPNVIKQFNSFFSRSKNTVLNTYLADAFKRNSVAYGLVRDADGKKSTNTLSSILDSQDKMFDACSTENISRKRTTLRTLPSFISLLFRVCYVIKHKARQIRIEYKNKQVNDEALFSFLFNRLHVFWRALIFFKCFKKTAHLPDCLVMLNPDNSSSEFNDFLGVRLPIICVADTTTDIASITYPIPSNDDSIVLFLFYLHIFLESSDCAIHMRSFLL